MELGRVCGESSACLGLITLGEMARGSERAGQLAELVSSPARFKIASKVKVAALKETQKMRGMSISCAAIAVAQEILLW